MLISKVKKLNLQRLSWNPPPPLPLIVTETRDLKTNWTFLSLMLTKRQTSSTQKINFMGVCVCLYAYKIFSSLILPKRQTSSTPNINTMISTLIQKYDLRLTIILITKLKSKYIYSNNYIYSRIIKTPWIRLKIWPVNWLERVMLYFKNDIGREYGW